MPRKNGDKLKLKKRLIIAMAIILATLLLLYIGTELLRHLSEKNEEPIPDETADYSFYSADYDEDIYADEEYVSLIQGGIITYHDSANTSYTVFVEKLDSYDKPVQLMVEMIYSAVNGDADAYNQCFSKKYFESNTPKEGFTKQKIYAAEIKYLNSDAVVENGVTYEKYEYEVSYRILKNNGTFRNDIGDGARKQLITVTDREGKLLIDSVQAYQYK